MASRQQSERGRCAVRVQLDRVVFAAFNTAGHQSLGTLGCERTPGLSGRAKDVQSDRFASFLRVVIVRVPWGNRVDEIDDGL